MKEKQIKKRFILCNIIIIIFSVALCLIVASKTGDGLERCDACTRVIRGDYYSASSGVVHCVECGPVSVSSVGGVTFNGLIQSGRALQLYQTYIISVVLMSIICLVALIVVNVRMYKDLIKAKDEDAEIYTIR